MVSLLTAATAFMLQLMHDLGVIHQASPGAFHLLPLGERSLQKLIRIVDDEMCNIDAQKLLLPLLTSGELWKSTGMTRRLTYVGSVHQSDEIMLTRHFSARETISVHTSVIALQQPTHYDLTYKNIFPYIICNKYYLLF